MRKIARLKRSVKSNTYFSLFILSLFTLSQAIFSSCADTEMEQLDINEPESLVAYDYLQDYDVLKAYFNHIGVVMDAETFLEKGMEYRIAVSNFTELVPGTAFSHTRIVKANGTVDTVSLASVRQLAAKHNMKLIGTPLIWHRQQNSTYLNALLAPNVIRPEGDDGGYCIKMTNTAASGNSTDAQVAYTFAKTPQVEPGISYKVKMRVRGTAEGTIQLQTYSNGKGSRFSPDITVTKEWTKVEAITTMASGIKGLTSILFNVGRFTGTLYIDDIELVEWNTNKQKEIGKNLNPVNTNLDDAEVTAQSTTIHSDANSTLEDVGVSQLGEGYDELATYVDKTDAEKQEILAKELEHYLTAVMEAGSITTTDWIVVNEPLADVTDDASLFFWQSYLGNYDYAVQAFKIASSHTTGNLFIGEKGLAEDPIKCQKLIDYIQAIEALGAKVDGIAVFIDANSETTSIESISQMFQRLATTGKIIRIADLQVSIDGSTTTEDATELQLKQQATMLESILKAYTAQIPAQQRGGVTFHQTLDTDQPLGLWTTDYHRKHSYGSMVTAFSN